MNCQHEVEVTPSYISRWEFIVQHTITILPISLLLALLFQPMCETARLRPHSLNMPDVRVHKHQGSPQHPRLVFQICPSTATSRRASSRLSYPSRS
ncbi:hypothetical protein M514_08827, partial [Trichuris suis]